MSHFRAGRWDGCISELTIATGLNPSFAEGYFWRAAAHFSKAISQQIDGLALGQIVPNCHQSIADYTRAIELDPSNAKAYINRSGVYRAVGRDNDSFRDMIKAKELDSYDERQMVVSPGIRKLIDQLRLQRFEGRTVEEAQIAITMSEIAPEKIFISEVTRNVQEMLAEGEGNDANTAIEAAQARIPSDAFDVHSADIVQHGQEGVVEVEAQIEGEARQNGYTQLPQGAILRVLKCEIAPKDGLFGIRKKKGLWKAHWSRPFKARISYKLPAQVTIRYTE